jgi:hypothetical protein
MTLAAVALVLVASVAAGWYFEHRQTPAASTATDAYQVKVTRAGRVLAAFDIAGLEAIGMKSVVVQGGSEEGPALRDVLQRAGAGDFSAVTVLGAGSRDAGRLELKAAQVTADTVLDIAKRGTVKIAGPMIPRDKRVRDITEIQVQ